MACFQLRQTFFSIFRFLHFNFSFTPVQIQFPNANYKVDIPHLRKASPKPSISLIVFKVNVCFAIAYFTVKNKLVSLHQSISVCVSSRSLQLCRSSAKFHVSISATSSIFAAQKPVFRWLCFANSSTKNERESYWFERNFHRSNGWVVLWQFSTNWKMLYKGQLFFDS